ncbi:SdrD B-like domain-containing protein [Lentzea sp. NPDC051838]|uniref:SdrD B-like domain-containing protein n=1 Tax=Lentzea sp. NPDC051838 TaxID=3154849 RepID=UPI00341E5FC4
MKAITRLAALALAVAAPLSLAGTAHADDTGSIYGFVWEDANNNGVREVGEAPIAGHWMYIDGTNKAAQSDANGRYEIKGLAAGSYIVGSGDRSLSHGQGWSRAGFSSRFSQANGKMTSPVQLEAGQQYGMFDSGFVTGVVDTKVNQLFISNPNPKVGDTIDIVGSTVHNGNVYDQFGGQLTLPEGLRVVERLGGMPKFYETEPAGKVTGYFYDRKPGGLPEWVGARVVVEKPLDGAEIKFDVWKGLFRNSDTNLSNDTETKTITTS